LDGENRGFAMHLHSGLYIVNDVDLSSRVFKNRVMFFESYFFIIEARSCSKEFNWLLVSCLVIIGRRVRKVAKSCC